MGLTEDSAETPPDEFPALLALETFDLFYRKEYPAVVGLAYALCGQRTVAEQLAQDAFAVASRRWGDLDPHESPGGFVRGVAANLAVSYRRRVAAMARALVRLAGGARSTIARLEPDDAAFWSTVRHLHRRQAQTVALFYLEDRSTEEIAAILASAEPAVRVYLHRARNALARLGAQPGADASPDDLEPIELDGGRTLTLDERGRLAAEGLRRAAAGEPPPLGGRNLGVNGWGRVMATALAVVLAAVGVTIFATDQRGSSGPVRNLTSRSATAWVVEVAHQLAARRFDAVANQLDPGPPLNIDALELRAEWGSITQKYGAYRSVGPVTQVESGFASAPLTMSRGDVTLAVGVLVDGHLGGVGFEPTVGADPPSLTYAYVAPKAIAEAHALAAGDFQAAVEDFDTLLGRTESRRAQLQDTWQELLRAYGPLYSIGDPTLIGPGTYGAAVVNVPLNMSGGRLLLEVSFDGNGQIRLVVPVLPNAPSETIVGIVASPTVEAADRARSIVVSLAGGSYQTVAAAFDRLAAANLTAAALRQQWQMIIDRLGRLTKTSAPALIAGTPTFVTYEIGLIYSHGDAHVQVSLDTQNLVQQLFISPGAPTRILGE